MIKETLAGQSTEFLDNRKDQISHDLVADAVVLLILLVVASVLALLDIDGSLHFTWLVLLAAVVLSAITLFRILVLRAIDQIAESRVERTIDEI